jgi:hypothetical protein
MIVTEILKLHSVNQTNTFGSLPVNKKEDSVGDIHISIGSNPSHPLMTIQLYFVRINKSHSNNNQANIANKQLIKLLQEPTLYSMFSKYGLSNRHQIDFLQLSNYQLIMQNGKFTLGKITVNFGC